MSIRKATLISNPRTGRYNSRRIPVEHIASLLRSRGIEVDLRPTTAPHDATEIAARAARNGSSAITLVGTPAELAQAFLGYKAIGITQFIISGWPKLEEMVIFGREVISLIRSAERRLCAIV